MHFARSVMFECTVRITTADVVLKISGTSASVIREEKKLTMRREKICRQNIGPNLELSSC